MKKTEKKMIKFSVWGLCVTVAMVVVPCFLFLGNLGKQCGEGSEELIAKLAILLFLVIVAVFLFSLVVMCIIAEDSDRGGQKRTKDDNCNRGNGG